MSNRYTAGLFVTLVFGLVLTLAGCATRERAVVYVRTPPPPPLAESILVTPGPGYVWVAGYHSWNGGGYIWVPGHWEHRPPGRRDWVPGHWAHNRHGWFWIEGHWR
jgi:hypothetical protein